MAIDIDESGGSARSGGSGERTRPTLCAPYGRPGPLAPGAYDIEPTSGGTRVKPRLVRNSPISTSGFGPGSRRRNIFITRRRPKNTDVLLWSDTARAMGASVSAGAP